MSSSTPKVVAMFSAMRRQPKRGLRRFSSMIAWMSSAEGLLVAAHYGSTSKVRLPLSR